jgi:hypothetical protein
MRKLPVAAAFSHVLRSTFNNIRFAWHTSWPWMLVLLPVNLAGNAYVLARSPTPGDMAETAGLVSVVIGLFTMFAFASIAVNWHRYILRDEIPVGWARLRVDNTVWRYFGNTLLIILMVMAALIPFVIVAALFVALLGNAGAIIALPVYVVGAVLGISLFYRLSVKLPGIALERRDYTFRGALADTAGNIWPLAGLALLMVLVVLAVALAFGLVTYGIAGATSTIAIVVVIALQVVINWFVTIMAVTLLTSLYGFFVEKREF